MTTIDVTQRPRPTPTPESQRYWDGLRRGEVLLQRCARCQRFQFYPRRNCRECGSTEVDWEPVSGRGHVYSFTVIHRAPFEAFEADVPYVYAVIEFDEGPRVVSRVVTDDVNDVQIGMRVVPHFETIDEELTLLLFRADSR